jgi:5-methylcytosine-specific restriction protein A
VTRRVSIRPCLQQRCPELVRGKESYCPTHRKDRGHHRADWPAIRARVLREQPICAECASARSVVCDHIVSRAAGGSDRRENLQGLCRPCHSRKTRAGG